MNNKKIENKVIVITGASSGIGQALALEFARRKNNMMITGRNNERLNNVAKEILSLNSNVITFTGDISIEENCKKIIESTINTYGKIDILVNNAGISMRALFSEVDISVLKKIMDINFWGTVYCTKYALPFLLQSKGSVVGISSVAGYRGLPGRSGYSASKFAMNGFLEVLRTENIKTGLHVLTACPGFTSSNIRNTALSKDGTPQAESPLDETKLMSAQKTAEKIINAIEKRKKFLILTKQGKLTVFLNKICPSIMDKIVYNHMAKEPNSPFK